MSALTEVRDLLRENSMGEGHIAEALEAAAPVIARIELELAEAIAQRDQLAAYLIAQGAHL